MTFLGVLKNKDAMESLMVELPEGATFGQLVAQLDVLVSESLAPWAWNKEERCFSPYILAMRNLVDVEDSQVALADGDEILILAPAVGG